MVGDQVRIEGKLVNVKAKLISPGGRFDSPEYSWNSSTSRTDSGAGACEVIYVEGITILKKANQFWRILFPISLYGILISVILYLFGFLHVLRKK